MKDFLLIILSELSQCWKSLIGLLSGPKSFVRMKDGNSENSLVQSAIFFGVSFVINSSLFIILLPSVVDLQRTAPEAVYKFLASLLEAGALYMLWRMVGGKAQFENHLIIFLYYSGIGLLIYSACFLCILGVLNSFYPELLKPPKIHAIEAGHGPSLFIILMLPVIPLVARWVWIYIGWGAYRKLNSASKRASAIAFISFLIFSTIVTSTLSFFIASGMGLFTTKWTDIFVF